MLPSATTKRLRLLGSKRLAHLSVVHPVRRMFGQSRAVNWGILFFALLVGMMLIRPLAMSGLSWHRTASLLDERRAEVGRLDKRNKELSERVKYYETDEFIAEQARLYGMVEPGEQAQVIREIVHPESASGFAISRLRNATTDSHRAITDEAATATGN